MNKNGAVQITSAWTFLGAAPAQVSSVTRNNPAFIIVADSAPADANLEGALLGDELPSISITTSGLIYGRTLSADALALVDVMPIQPDGVVMGQGVISVAGAAQQLFPAGMPITPGGGMLVKASVYNTGVICIGAAGVNNKTDGTGNGWRLNPGEAYPFSGRDASKLWAAGTVAGDTFDYSVS